MPAPKPSSWRQRRRRLTLLSAVVAVSLAAACRRPPAPAAAPAPPSDNVWAVVDGREITRDAVERAYQGIRDPSQTVSEEEAFTARLSLLNDLILQDILIAKAGELKVEVAGTALDEAYAEARKNVTDEVFQKELARRGVTAEDMREGLRREMLAQAVIDREVGSKVAVTDQEINDFFSANRAQFNFAEESFHLAQIAITPVRDVQLTNRTGDDAGTPEAASAKVAMLMERLKAGAAFNELAMDFSEDPESAPRGGDLGLVPLSRLKQAPPLLRDAVLKTTPGTVSVASAGGAHTLVLLVAREPAGQRELSTPGVRERITEVVRTRREQLLRAAYLTSVRGDAQVVNYLARRLVESQGRMPNPQPAAPKP